MVELLFRSAVIPRCAKSGPPFETGFDFDCPGTNGHRRLGWFFTCEGKMINGNQFRKHLGKQIAFRPVRPSAAQDQLAELSRSGGYCIRRPSCNIRAKFQ